jgi:hypothetical protein
LAPEAADDQLAAPAPDPEPAAQAVPVPPAGPNAPPAAAPLPPEPRAGAGEQDVNLSDAQTDTVTSSNGKHWSTGTTARGSSSTRLVSWPTASSSGSRTKASLIFSTTPP